MFSSFSGLSQTHLRKGTLLCPIIVLLLCLSLVLTRPAAASSSSITYTGQLLVAGTPVTGSYDFQFQLFNAATGGTQVGSTISLSAVPVADGIYYASLDFGSGIIIGQNLWIQVSYRVHPSSGSPAYTTVTPRTLAPNAASADYAQLSGSTAALQGKPISTVAPTSGQVLEWSGSLWTPFTPPVAPTYTAGTGLTLSGTQFSVTTGGITNSLLAAGSVGPSKITSGAISGDKLALPLTASVSSSSDLFTLTNTGGGRAIVGNSASNTAVKGVGHNGVYGLGTNYGVQASGTNYGVYSVSPAVGVYGSGTGSSGIGVYGSGTTYGVQASSGGTGISGTGTSTYSTGVYGKGGTSGVGLYGTGNDGVEGYGTYVGTYGFGGVYGMYGSGTSYGVYGSSSNAGVYGAGSNTGVYGYDSANGTYGILGTKSSYGWDTGVVGESEGTTFYKMGVEGKSLADSGFGIWGVGDETGTKTGNYAGYFSGNVYVNGTLSKAGGSFKIDDPLDPAHKYLSHSFVESPDMKNIYDGTATTDTTGNATITLPDYFEVLNQDFRYQLTCIGQFAQAIVATEIDGNQFTIKTDKPNVKVSWQVTGTRHDAWANAHRIPVEEDKPKGEQGHYLHPKEFGQPDSLAIMPQHPGDSAQLTPPKQPDLPSTQQ